jgi:hypothetical protein
MTAGRRAFLGDVPAMPNAACKGTGTIASAKERLALFFGPPGERPREAGHREAEAKAICQRCPHLDECRRWALVNPDDVGDTHTPHSLRDSPTYVGQIIGGLTFVERYAIREGRPVPVRLRIVPREPEGNGRRGDINHGTSGGYSTHVRRGEVPCDDCKRERNRVRRENHESTKRRAKLRAEQRPRQITG